MDNRTLWNERYIKGLPSLDIPDPFFVEMYDAFIRRAFPSGGKALDLAAGTGRHTLYLGNNNWQVSAVDISNVAIERLSAAAADMPVAAVCSDIINYPLQTAAFDLIVLYYYFDRPLFTRVVDALKPGGLLISKQAVGKPANPAALQEEELLQLTKGLDQVYYHERPVRDRGVVEYLGGKPII
jgi:SAM-dependent methyltransferase